MPASLIQSTKHFKGNVYRLKKIIPNINVKVTFVSEHRAVMVFPADILNMMKVINTCRRHVKR